MSDGPSAPVRIIVNADDLGISSTVNCAIFDLMAEGRITSATLLANGPALAEAVRTVPHLSSCSFGVHLNLSEFPPLSQKAAMRLSRQGEMSRALIGSLRPTPTVLQAAYEEFCAQVGSLLNRGVPLTHIDSHQHVHTFAWIFPVLKAVQKRYGIRRVRCSRNIYAPGQAINPALRIKKQIFNLALRSIYCSRTTDGFTDLCALVASVSQTPSAETSLGAAGKSACATFPTDYRAIEVMVHPGARNHEGETAILRSDWLNRLPFRAELISYHHL